MSNPTSSPAIWDVPPIKQNDYVYIPFVIWDTNGNPINFSGYTSAKCTLRLNENSAAAFSFTSSGSTIDISERATGSFALITNSLAIAAGTYLFDFQLSNSTQNVTPLTGTIPVLTDLTI